MQSGVPFLEDRDRAEREDKRLAGFACRSVPQEHAVDACEQRRPDEVRELVRNEAPEHSAASEDPNAAEEDQEAGHHELPPGCT